MFESIIKLILQASLTAGIAAAAVMLLRLPLKKAPKRWSYILWAVVFFRCLCPFSVESGVSIFNAVPEQQEIGQQVSDAVYEYTPIDYDPVYIDYSGNADFNKTDISEQTAVRKAPKPYTILFIVWVSGAAVMVLYAVISYVRLMGKMNTAIKTEEGIYETDRVSTAFSAGLFPPKIFLPCGLSKKERQLIVAHERVHIRRLDFIFKPLAFIGLALHWFNPMVWISFALMTKDMELSCDEAVLKIMGTGEKKSYSNALLKVSMKRSGLTALPLAFAGSGIKERVKNVLGYKKSGIIATVIAAVVVLTAGVVLGTDAVRNSDAAGMNPETLISADNSFYIGDTAVENSSGEMIFIQRNNREDTDIGLKHLLVYSDDTGMTFEGRDFKDVDITNIDPEKIAKVVIRDLRTGHYDENDFEDVENGDFTYIGVDMELYMTDDNDKAPKAEYSSEYIENDTVITKMCGGSEHLYGMYFEIEIPQSAFRDMHGDTFRGYGIELTGFGDAEIYIADNLKIADFRPPVNTVMLDEMENGTGPLDDNERQKIIEEDNAKWEQYLEEEKMRLEEEKRRDEMEAEEQKRREEEQERQKRLDEESAAMEAEKNDLAESSVEVIIDEGSDKPFLYFNFSADDSVSQEGDKLPEGSPKPDVILQYPIEDPLNTVITKIEPYGTGDVVTVYENGETYFNKGLNFPVPEGTPVYASADGKIINAKDKGNGYGNCLIIAHSDELATLYAHLSEMLVQDGDEVKAGDLIGYSGRTGYVYGATLHFEVRVNGQHTDPIDFLEKID